MISSILEMAGGRRVTNGIDILKQYKYCCMLLNDEDGLLGEIVDINKYAINLVNRFISGNKRLIDTSDGLLKVTEMVMEHRCSAFIVPYLLSEFSEKFLSEDVDLHNVRGTLYDYASKFESLWIEDKDSIFNYSIVDNKHKYITCVQDGGISYMYYELGNKILRIARTSSDRFNLKGISPLGTVAFINTLVGIMVCSINKDIQVVTYDMSVTQLRKDLVLKGVV